MTTMTYVGVGVSSRAFTINCLAPRRERRFVLIHPDVPSQKRHYERNYTLANERDEAVAVIRSGYHARMVSVENEQAEDVIINANIKICEFP